MSEAELDPDRIEASRGSGNLGRKVLIFRETASTNDLVLRLGEAGEAEGIVVIAERQTAGRGQFGRRWDSATGAGLWLSLLLRPLWPAGELPGITPLVAVAVTRAVAAATGLAPWIKPPNDIFIGPRKAAGILTEARTGRATFAAVGIGINVKQRITDFPIDLQATATSLEIETGELIDRENLAGVLMAELNRIYRPDRSPTAEILEAYADLCGPFRSGGFVIA